MSEALQQIYDEMMAPGQMFETTEVEVRGQALRAWKAAPATLRDFWAMTAP